MPPRLALPHLAYLVNRQRVIGIGPQLPCYATSNTYAYALSSTCIERSQTNKGKMDSKDKNNGTLKTVYEDDEDYGSSEETPTVEATPKGPY